MNLVKHLTALLVSGITVVSAMDDTTEAGREAIKRAEEARSLVERAISQYLALRKLIPHK